MVFYILHSLLLFASGAKIITSCFIQRAFIRQNLNMLHGEVFQVCRAASAQVERKLPGFLTESVMLISSKNVQTSGWWGGEVFLFAFFKSHLQRQQYIENKHNYLSGWKCFGLVFVFLRYIWPLRLSRHGCFFCSWIAVQVNEKAQINLTLQEHIHRKIRFLTFCLFQVSEALALEKKGKGRTVYFLTDEFCPLLVSNRNRNAHLLADVRFWKTLSSDTKFKCDNVTRWKFIWYLNSIFYL